MLLVWERDGSIVALRLDALLQERCKLMNISLELYPTDLCDYFDKLESGAVRIKGHRIGLEHIVERYNQGYSPEQIMLDFPGLSMEKIYATITYYLRHKNSVDDYLTRLNRWANKRMQDHDKRYPVALSEELKQRLSERWREEQEQEQEQLV